MAASENTPAPSMWDPPECPFTIEYSSQTLDDIRLAVVDAFFSLPRGGAEIGGVLFGNWDGGRLAITDYAALDCEHAFGPSFTLSPPDEARLTALLVAPVGNGTRPVGWYHSHTRSEIFLSDADREIHRRFFPEAWQVALVLRPHTFHPTRAGFFFRGADGGIHAETSYREFVLTPLMVKPAPSGAPAPASRPAKAPEPPEEPAPVAEPTPAAEPVPHLPKFLATPPPPRSRRWVYVTLALLVGFGLGAAGYLKRDLWLLPLLALPRQPIAATAPPSVGLNTIDNDGQLQIRWNRNSPAIQQTSGGVLSINEGKPFAREIPLDKAHLLSGVATIARQTDLVDVGLTLTQPGGGHIREVTTFMGKLPGPKSTEDAASQQQREDLAKQVAKMQTDLNAEIERNAKLKKSVDLLTKQLNDQRRVRLLNQIPK